MRALDGVRPHIRPPGLRSAPLALPQKISCRARLTKGCGAIITGGSGWSSNLVVNNGLNGLGTTAFSALATHCHAGTANAAPAAGDTTLGGFHKATSNIITTTATTQNAPPYYTKVALTWRFAAGAITQPIGEVGFSNQVTDGGLFGKAQVRDLDGELTYVNPGADEWLDVTYEFRLYPDWIDADGNPVDGEGIIDFEGDSYNYWIRPALVTDASHWVALDTRATFRSVSGIYAKFFGPDSVLGAVTGEPTDPDGADADSTNSSILAATYTPGSFQRDITLYIGRGDGNASGGVGGIRFNTRMGAYQMRFEPAIPKDSLKTWHLDIRLAWANSDLV